MREKGLTPAEQFASVAASSSRQEGLPHLCSRALSIASVRSYVSDAHLSDQLARDLFGIDHGFLCCHIGMQVLRLDTPEATQVRPAHRAHALTGGARDFAVSITIVVSRPCVPTVAHGDPWWPR